MRFVQNFLADNWNKQLETIVDGRSPLTNDHEFNEAFPFGTASEFTKRYLISKKERAVPGVADERLMKLIQRSDAKDVALAACTDFLSSQAIRTLVVRDFSRLDARLYLRLLLLAHRGSPAAVDEEEYTRAKAVLFAFDFNSAGIFVDSKFLRALLEITVKTPVPKTSLVYSTLQTAIVSACPRLKNELFERQHTQQWNRCWKLMSWMPMLIEEPLPIPADHLDPIELLDSSFLNWRMWAVWQPIHCKVAGPKASDEQRENMRSFLALEGPDQSQPPQINFCEQLKSQEPQFLAKNLRQIGAFTFELTQETESEEAKEMLDRLHHCTSYAFATHETNIDLLIRLCAYKVIKTESLEIMEAVESAGDPVITRAVLDLLLNLFDPLQKWRVAKSLLLLLSHSGCEKIKQSIVGRMVIDAMTGMVEASQALLQTAWENNNISAAIANEVTLQSDVAAIQLAADFSWISILVDKNFMDLIKSWPTDEDIATLQEMRKEVGAMRGISARVIAGHIDVYLKDLLVKHGVLDDERRAILQTLMAFWRRTESVNAKTLAMSLANGSGKFRRDCISQLHLLTDDYILTLAGVMRDWAKHPDAQDLACVNLSTFLTFPDSGIIKPDDVKIAAAWKPVLYRMLKARGSALVQNAPKILAVQPYVTFVRNIQRVFGDKVAWNPKMSPPIMNPIILGWISRLEDHLPVLQRLANEKRGQSAVQYFLDGSDPWILEGILCHLALEDCWVGKTALYEASYGITCMLSLQPTNAQEVYDVLCSVYQMSLSGAAACARLLDLCQSDQRELGSILLPSWLRDPTWSENDQIGLKDTAKLLKIDPQGPTEVTSGALTALADLMDARYLELIVEAKRLDYMRVGLKTRDCDGVSYLLDECQIEDATAMEDAFARLPVELLNVVETVNDSEVEILFPLNNLSILQRAALGLGNAQTLLVRLYIGDYGDQPKFCIHLDNEPKLDSHDVHAQWVVFRTTREPEMPICHGSITPVTYQLARMLSRYLVGGFKDILSIYTLVSTSLKTMGSACIVCGTHHGAILRKATICDSWDCMSVFSRAPVEIRLADIRQDPMAVDMLLTMIQSAITSGYHNLLPNCPIDKDTCLKILKTLPSMQSLAKAKNFAANIKNRHDGKTEQFLTWVCCSFRGFLSTATGSLRIPSLPPGTLQFVLANVEPMKELTFLSEFSANTQQSRVVFHGTSLDRLYLILHQGLKSMSGTPLQVYGAAAGPGIYLAEEPSTSWAYADRKAAARPNWTNSAIKNGRVLLGCEMTGPSTATGRGGVHVIQKEGSVMVRYIFVIPTSTITMPIAGHVSPAMMSVFNSLRSGAL